MVDRDQLNEVSRILNFLLMNHDKVANTAPKIHITTAWAVSRNWRAFLRCSAYHFPLQNCTFSKPHISSKNRDNRRIGLKALVILPPHFHGEPNSFLTVEWPQILHSFLIFIAGKRCQDFTCQKPITAYDNRQPPIDEFSTAAFKLQSFLGVGRKIYLACTSRLPLICP